MTALALTAPKVRTERQSPLNSRLVLAELAKVSFARVRLSLRATTPITLPAHSGSTLRGGFGAALKASVCTVASGDCSRCLLRTQCAYSYLFETPIEVGSTRLASAAHAPHPFVIDPVGAPVLRYQTGESFRIDFTLFGDGAINRLPYVVHAMESLGQTTGLGKRSSEGQPGQFVLIAVSQLCERGVAIPLFDDCGRTLAAPRPETLCDLIDPEFSPSRTARVTFSTPTRLMFDGAPVTTPEFHVLVRNLLRRASNLAFFHSRAELMLPFRELIDLARQVVLTESTTAWATWERYSRRQRRRLPMAGLVGEATYTGDFRALWPLLCLGELTHVGKHVAFGMGRLTAALGDPDPVALAGDPVPEHSRRTV